MKLVNKNAIKPNLVQRLGQKTHVQEVVGSNPAIYCMDVSDLLAITLKKIENKGSQMGHTEKKYIKKLITLHYIIFICRENREAKN